MRLILRKNECDEIKHQLTQTIIVVLIKETNPRTWGTKLVVEAFDTQSWIQAARNKNKNRLLMFIRVKEVKEKITKG